MVALASIFQRFTAGFMTLVWWLLDVVMDEANPSVPRPPGPLAFFKDVLCEDATFVTLHDELASAWPGSSPAAAEVHARIRVTTGELLKAKVTPGRVADCRAFGVGHELRNTLLIFNQGEFTPSLWRRVASVGGDFLFRVVAGSVLRVARQVESLSTEVWCGRQRRTRRCRRTASELAVACPLCCTGARSRDSGFELREH